jgi:hypothetical protein
MGFFSKPSREEMQARYRAAAERSILKNGELPTVPAGTQQVIYTPYNGLGLNYGDVAPTIIERNGRKFIRNPHGAGDYVFNERTGAYHAGGGDGGILMFSPAKADEEDEDKKQSSSSGSGGSGGSGGDNNGGGGGGGNTDQGTVTYARPKKKVLGNKVALKTILGDSYNSMANYTPVTAGQPQNTLVNTGNWMVQLDPNNALAVDPGQVTYGNNVVLNPYVIS